jgi:hypothetical protein
LTCPWCHGTGFYKRVIDVGPQHGPGSYTPRQEVVSRACNCGSSRANRRDDSAPSTSYKKRARTGPRCAGQRESVSATNKERE